MTDGDHRLSPDAAALVATVNDDEERAGSKPAAIVRRMVAFGVETAVQVATQTRDGALAPETKNLLETVQEWVASPRKRADLRERLTRGWTFAEMSKDGGLIVRPGASPAALVAGAASHLAFATASPDGVPGARKAVAAAIERLVLATSRDLVARTIMEGIAEEGPAGPPRRARRRRADVSGRGRLDLSMRGNHER